MTQENEQTTAMQVYDASNTLQEMTQAGKLDKYLYSFKQGKQEISDLNVDGINRLAIACGVSIEEVAIIDEDETQITVQAIAVNPDGLNHHGIARESKYNQYGKPNQHALANAVSKAQRNAKKGLLPMAEVREAIRNAGRTPNEAEHREDETNGR